MAFDGVPFHIVMIIFIHGKESYLVLQKLSLLKAEFLKKHPDSQLGEFDLEEDGNIEQIAGMVASGSSLFSDKKLIILRKVFSLAKSNQDKLHRLLKDAAKADEDLTVIVVETGTPQGKLSAYLKKKSKQYEFAQLGPKKLEEWINQQVQARSEGSKTISKAALANLCEITQCDLWQISNELDKLVQFCSKAEIGISDLAKISKGQIGIGIFDLVDAIGAKDKPRAIELKNNLVMQGDNEFYIFSMIHSQLRNIIKLNECMNKGMADPGLISKKCGMHPFVVRKTMSQRARFGKGELKGIFSLAAKIDLEAKSGKIDIGEALDYFIVKI